MVEEISFAPNRRPGLIFHSFVILLLLVGIATGLWFAAYADIGLNILLTFLPSLAGIISVPFLAFRIYSLQRASYTLSRDGLIIRWGLRQVQIPMKDVLQVQLVEELRSRPPLPKIRWPGSVIGTRRLPNGTEIEYLAANSSRLVLVSVPKRIFAISPADPDDFLGAFQRLLELGSLTPLPRQSVYPTFLLAQVWESRLGRGLILGGLIISLLLLIGVSLAIPQRTQIPLGFQPDGSPGAMVPAARLLLLPVVNALQFTAGLTAGIFFFRRREYQPVAYLLWGSGAVSALFFLISAAFILYYR